MSHSSCWAVVVVFKHTIAYSARLKIMRVQEKLPMVRKLTECSFPKLENSLFLLPTPHNLLTYPSCLLEGGACVMTEVGEGSVGCRGSYPKCSGKDPGRMMVGVGVEMITGFEALSWETCTHCQIPLLDNSVHVSHLPVLIKIFENLLGLPLVRKWKYKNRAMVG